MKVNKLKSGKYSITDISEDDRQDLTNALLLAAWYTNEVPAPTKDGKADPVYVARKEKRIARFDELRSAFVGA